MWLFVTLINPLVIADAVTKFFEGGWFGINEPGIFVGIKHSEVRMIAFESIECFG